MTFLEAHKLKELLRQSNQLTHEQLEGAPPNIRALDEFERNRLFAELICMLAGDVVSLKAAIDSNCATIREFDKSSQRLSRWLIGLTTVIVVLTVVIAIFTTVLVFKK